MKTAAKRRSTRAKTRTMTMRVASSVPKYSRAAAYVKAAVLV